MLINKTSSIENNFSPINQLAFLIAASVDELLFILEKGNNGAPVS